MKTLKQILYKIFHPYTAVIVFLVPVSAALLIYAFAAKAPALTVQYAAYFISAYTLTALCFKIPVIYGKINKIKHENRYAVRYFSDASLRVKFSLYGSFGINTFYVVMQFYMGLYNHSVWFYALSGYYFLLAFMRFFLLKEIRKEEPGKNIIREYRSYRMCGAVLLLMNAALSVITFYILRQNRGFSYHYILTIAMAAYTFCTFTSAIINLVRYRRYNSPVMSAAKAVSFSAALVSMLSLETAMLSAFGEENDPVFRRTVTAFTGGAVCISVLLIAVYMIVHSAKQLKYREISNE